MRRNKGFTLVEIMIVIAIIGLLAAIAIPNFLRARRESQAQACRSNMEQIYGAKQEWAFKKRATDEPGTADLDPYLSGDTFPTCPADDSAYTIGTPAENTTCNYANAAAEGHVME